MIVTVYTLILFALLIAVVVFSAKNRKYPTWWVIAFSAICAPLNVWREMGGTLLQWIRIVATPEQNNYVFKLIAVHYSLGFVIYFVLASVVSGVVILIFKIIYKIRNQSAKKEPEPSENYDI